MDALALALLDTGKEGKHAAKYGVPDEDMRAKAAVYVKEQNDLNQRYGRQVTRLTGLEVTDVRY